MTAAARADRTSSVIGLTGASSRRREPRPSPSPPRCSADPRSRGRVRSGRTPPPRHCRPDTKRFTARWTGRSLVSGLFVLSGPTWPIPIEGLRLVPVGTSGPDPSGAAPLGGSPLPGHDEPTAPDAGTSRCRQREVCPPDSRCLRSGSRHLLLHDWMHVRGDALCRERAHSAAVSRWPGTPAQAGTGRRAPGDELGTGALGHRPAAARTGRSGRDHRAGPRTGNRQSQRGATARSRAGTHSPAPAPASGRDNPSRRGTRCAVVRCGRYRTLFPGRRGGHRLPAGLSRRPSRPCPIPPTCEDSAAQSRGVRGAVRHHTSRGRGVGSSGGGRDARGPGSRSRWACRRSRSPRAVCAPGNAGRPARGIRW